MSSEGRLYFSSRGIRHIHKKSRIRNIFFGRIAAFDYSAVGHMLTKDPKLINYSCEMGLSRNSHFRYGVLDAVVTPLMYFFINKGWMAGNYLEYPYENKIIKNRKRTIKLLRLLLKKGADCNISSIQDVEQLYFRLTDHRIINDYPKQKIDLFLFFSNYIFLDYKTADTCLQMLLFRGWNINQERHIRPIPDIPTKIWLNEEQEYSTKYGISIPWYSHLVINNYLRMQKKLLSYSIRNKNCNINDKCKFTRVIQNCPDDIFRYITSYL